MSQTIRFVDSGYIIYVVWKPSLQVCQHNIVQLNSGAFEVTCFHEKFDETAIREDVRKRIQYLVEHGVTY